MITSILLIVLCITSLLFFTLYMRLKNKALSIIKSFSKPIRIGYYKLSCTQGNVFDYESTVYVNEIDRYTNGESKIELDRIEIYCEESGLNHEHAKNFVYKNFKGLVKTSYVTWLESETVIKEQRKEKLNRLKELLK